MNQRRTIFLKRVCRSLIILGLSFASACSSRGTGRLSSSSHNQSNLGQTEASNLESEFSSQYFSFVKNPARAELFWEMSKNPILGEVSPIGAKMITASLKLSVVAKYLQGQTDFTPDLNALIQMPQDTLGYAYGKYMIDHKLDPGFFPLLSETNDTHKVLNWTRKTHDIMHLVAGYGSEFGEELGWQAFYAANAKSHLGMVVVSMGLLHLAMFNREHVLEHLKIVTEAYERGLKAASLVDVDWMQVIDRPIEDLRKELKLSSRQHHISTLSKKRDISY